MQSVPGGISVHGERANFSLSSWSRAFFSVDSFGFSVECRVSMPSSCFRASLSLRSFAMVACCFRSTL